MSRCTSDLLAGGAGDSRGTEIGIHDGSSTAGDWTRPFAPSASSARALTVLSRRPGLALFDPRRRALPLSLREHPGPPGLRSLLAAAVDLRAVATHAVAMTTTKPLSHPQPQVAVGLERTALEGSYLATKLGWIRPGAGGIGGPEWLLGAFGRGNSQPGRLGL